MFQLPLFILDGSFLDSVQTLKSETLRSEQNINTFEKLSEEINNDISRLQQHITSFKKKKKNFIDKFLDK